MQMSVSIISVAKSWLPAGSWLKAVVLHCVQVFPFSLRHTFKYPTTSSKGLFATFCLDWCRLRTQWFFDWQSHLMRLCFAWFWLGTRHTVDEAAINYGNGGIVKVSSVWLLSALCHHVDQMSLRLLSLIGPVLNLNTQFLKDASGKVMRTVE